MTNDFMCCVDDGELITISSYVIQMHGAKETSEKSGIYITLNK